MNTFLKFWKKYSFSFLILFIILSLFDLRFSIIAAICMVSPIVISIFRGRFWCGNLCPRGNFYDNIISKISAKRKPPKIFKSYIFRFLILTLMMIVFISGLYKNWGNLYGIGMIFYRLIVVTTIIGILLSLIYNHRTWCSFCPMGTLGSIISKFNKKKKVLIVSNTCFSCKICEKKCPFGLVPYNYKDNLLSHPDCIQCGQCASACPKQSISYNNYNNIKH